MINLFEEDVNLKKDELLLSKTIVFYDNNYEVYSHHDVKNTE